MNILILSWRDPYHPLAGGAERITQKYAEYWIEKGHQVWWMSAAFPGGQDQETVNKIQYIRVRPRLSHIATLNLILYPLYLLHTMFKAWRLIRTAKIDKVIDEIHGLPFFTPLFAADRSVLLVCEVAGPIWDKMYGFPINKIGKVAELITYYLYRTSQIWAISNNTKKDILAIIPAAKIKLLPIGVESSDLQRPAKRNSAPSAVFLARLVKMKGVESVISVASLICQQLADFHLTIIGSGEGGYVNYLKNLVKEKNLEKNITFSGSVSESQKYRLLAESHALLHTSYKEGFGLTVIEAGLVETPTIGRRGSSLDELIQVGVDGFLVSTDEQMAEAFIKIYQQNLFSKMGQQARKKSLQHTWEYILPQSNQITGL